MSEKGEKGEKKEFGNLTLGNFVVVEWTDPVFGFSSPEPPERLSSAGWILDIREDYFVISSELATEARESGVLGEGSITRQFTSFPYSVVDDVKSFGEVG